MKNDVSTSPPFPGQHRYGWLPTWPRLTAPMDILATPRVVPIEHGKPLASETEAVDRRRGNPTPVAEAA